MNGALSGALFRGGGGRRGESETVKDRGRRGEGTDKGKGWPGGGRRGGDGLGMVRDEGRCE